MNQQDIILIPRKNYPKQPNQELIALMRSLNQDFVDGKIASMKNIWQDDDLYFEVIYK